MIFVLIGKLAAPTSSENEKETSGEKPVTKQKLPRPCTIKSRRTNRKNTSSRRLGNTCKSVDFVEDFPGDSVSNDQKTGVKEQKYFIVVEESSSKSTESLIFLVEENPIQLKRSSKNSSKNTRKKPRLESIKKSVIESSDLSHQNGIASNEPKRIEAAEGWISMPAMNGDIQSDKVVSSLTALLLFLNTIFL